VKPYTCGLVVIAAFAVSSARSRAADLTTLVNFCGANELVLECPDGAKPFAGLILDANGNLIGATIGGGALSDGVGPIGPGTIFEISKTVAGYASTPTTLASLSDEDDAGPYGGLIADINGNLFGTTTGGGAYGFGTVFEIAKTATGYASTVTTLVSFNGINGAVPAAGLIADAAGNLFGTTSAGGAHSGGTVFEIANTATGYASTPTTLISFNGGNGARPFAGMVADRHGNLFGTTSDGGAHGGGTVFQITKTTTGYASTATTLVDFCSLPNCTDGAAPYGGLVVDADGNLFGTTSEGGAHGGGTVFEIIKTSGGHTRAPNTLVNFCSLPNCADGAVPYAGLIADADGNLFGTTIEGGGLPCFLGECGLGTVFKIAKTPKGYANTPTILVSFNNANGARPYAGLVADTNGNLFGTTIFSFGFGTVFEITGSGFIPPTFFAGTPGSANCASKSILALTKKYGGFDAAAAALGYSSAPVLLDDLAAYCAA